MKYKIVVLLCLVSLLFSGFSLPTKSALAAAEHPRLYFTQADLPALRALETAPSHQAIWSYMKISADAMIGQKIGLGSYDITEQEIHTMCLVWAMTGDTKYAEQLKTWCLWLAAEPDWGIPGWGQEPFSAATTSMAFAYDVLYNYLTEADKATIRNALIARVNTFYQYYLPYYPLINQHYPNVGNMIAGSIGIAGLALEGDYDGATNWINWAKGCSQQIINVDGDPDGGWFEGPQYATSFYYLFAFFDALERIKGEDLFDNEFLRNLPYFLIWCTYNDQFLPVEDTESQNTWNFRALFFLYKLASEYNDGYAQWLASRGEMKAMEAAITGSTSTLPLSFLYLWKNSNIPIKPPNDLPLTRYFSGIGYVFHRTGWTNSDYVLAFKSGSSRAHAHADQNAWSLYGPSGDGVISGNPGYLYLAADNQTKNSNTILANGLGQAQEPGSWGTAPLGTRGIIEQLDVRSTYIYARGDAHASYLGLSNSQPELASGDLIKFMRHLVIMENPFYFVVYDDVAAPQPEQLDWLFSGNGGSFTTNGHTITLNHGVNLNALVVEPSSFVAQLVTNTRTRVNDSVVVTEPQMRVHPITNTNATNFLIAMFPGTTLPTTKIKQGNLLGMIVDIDATHKDLILYSTDGQPVSQWIELGRQYTSNDGQAYTFNGTQVQASFSTYKVMRLVASSGTQLNIITNSLPNGIVGIVYSQPLTVNGGTTPYTWTITSGTLPADLSLSSGGVITGTPTTAGGPASITFKVTDSASAMATKTLSIVVSHANWDVNMDGFTNVLDMIIISQHWGETGASGWIRADVNQDGTINVLDNTLVGQHWTG